MGSKQQLSEREQTCRGRCVGKLDTRMGMPRSNLLELKINELRLLVDSKH
jgi:hypothetical protein